MSETPTPYPSEAGARTGTSNGTNGRPTRAPNYAARRMLVTTIAIAAVAAIAIFAWDRVSGDSDDAPGEADGWTQIALVDRATGSIVTVDDEGQQVGEFAGDGRVERSYANADGGVALVASDRIVINDLDGDPVVVPVTEGAAIERLLIDDALRLAVGSPTGGNLVVVDGETGMQLDIAALADQTNPLIFPATMQFDASGSAFAAADANNFQTILVRFDAPDPVFYPDVPVAVGESIVATSQAVGPRADIGIFDESGSNLTIVPSEIPAGGVFDGDDLVLVSVDGTITRIGKDDDEATRLGVVAVPAASTVRSVLPTFDGSRMVVSGDVFEAVIDLDGSTVFTTTFTTPIDVDAPEPDWACLPVGGGADYHSLISLDTGEMLADLTGLDVTGTSSDGCTVVGVRSGSVEVVGENGILSLGRLRDAVLGPDGRSIVQRTTDGRVELLLADDDLTVGSPIDLTALAPTNLDVVFLDR